MHVVEWNNDQLTLSPFETGPDGFPRPGQVVRSFRRQKKRADGKPWTQKDLAGALGIQELAVRAMELRDVGLQDVMRHRRLIWLLAIPPELLGLASPPGPSSWWVQEGYPNFETGPDGFPRPGQVVRYFRRQKKRADGKPWTQADLAYVLGIQELAVRFMELRDSGLNDLTRRRFLSQLLTIPPVLLGLAPFPSVQQNHRQQNHGTIAPRSLSRDLLGSVLERIRRRTDGFWSKGILHPQQILRAVDSDLRRISECYPFARLEQERQVVLAALCEAHIHLANILRDLGQSEALCHLDKAYTLTETLSDRELRADVLYRRGGAYLDVGAVSQALQNYAEASSLSGQISPQLRAALSLESAVAEARQRGACQDLLPVLKRLDEAGKLIRQYGATPRPRERGPYLYPDEQRYHLDRAAVLLSLRRPKEALEELHWLTMSSFGGRRGIYFQVLQAQAYGQLREYEEAASVAAEVLPLIYRSHSHVNLRRITALYQQLHVAAEGLLEVERLGYLLFRQDYLD